MVPDNQVPEAKTSLLFASHHLCQPNSPQALLSPFILPKTGPARRSTPGRIMEVTITRHLFSRHQERTLRPGGGWGSAVNAQAHPGWVKDPEV